MSLIGYLSPPLTFKLIKYSTYIILGENNHYFLFFGLVFQKIETNLNEKVVNNHVYCYYVYGFIPIYEKSKTFYPEKGK